MPMLMHQLRLFFVALQFLTRLPTPRWVGFEPAWLHRSARYFPAVGFFVGLVAAAVFAAAHRAFGPAVAAVLCIAATVLLTGAFHEDGFADTCDGLGGAVGRERALEIMKDSRIGAYGAVGLVLMLGLKAATLASMAPATAVAALLFAHTASRAAAVAVMGALPYAGDAGHAKAKPMAHQVRPVDLALALATAALLALLLLAFSSAPSSPISSAWHGGWLSLPEMSVAAGPATVMSSLLAATAMTLWCASWLKRRLGGFTGDTLGATQQLVEVAMLLAWLVQ